MPAHMHAPRAAAVEFGKRVNRRRVALGMTRNGFARDMGVDRMTVRFIETGRNKPSFGMLLALADALDTDPCELVRGLHRYED
jgi:transcriptional regulator with XRE-family HTH domain